MRGDEGAYEIAVGAWDIGEWDVRLFDPRSGEWRGLGLRKGTTDLHFRTPDEQDWLVVAIRK